MDLTSPINQYEISNDHPTLPLWEQGPQGSQDHPRNTNMISTKSAKSINIKHNFTMLSTNMRSLNANHENLYSIIDSITNPSVLILSEIWNRSESCLTIDGYYPLIKSTRPSRSGGGLGIYISKIFEIFENFNLPVPLTIKTFEFTYAKVKTHKKKLIISLIISLYLSIDLQM